MVVWKDQSIEITLSGKNWQVSYQNLAILVLIILYLVGIVGMALPIHPDFALLTPVNLLISLGLVLFFHSEWNQKTYLFLLLSYCIGFGAELVGVQTGLLFGDYHYGPVLGPKIMGTPLMIGINWILLAYSTGVLVNRFLLGKNIILKAVAGASLMVLLDIFIEPIAIQYDFWTWTDRLTPPMQNFVGWWIVAFFVHLIFQWLLPKTQNKVGLALLALQFIFFFTLNLI